MHWGVVVNIAKRNNGNLAALVRLDTLETNREESKFSHALASFTIRRFMSRIIRSTLRPS
jgi:hypothetical protein